MWLIVESGAVVGVRVVVMVVRVMGYELGIMD